MFLYARVLKQSIGKIGGVVTAKRPPRLPTVLSHHEAMLIIDPTSNRATLATELLRRGSDIRTVQTLLGHADVRITQIYTHVLGQGFAGVQSPLG